MHALEASKRCGTAARGRSGSRRSRCCTARVMALRSVPVPASGCATACRSACRWSWWAISPSAAPARRRWSPGCRKHLAACGMRVAIVSRGYGGRARGVTRVTVHSRASEVGDEPLLLARRAQATVFVGARPGRGGEGRGGRWRRHRDLRRRTAAPGAGARLRNRGHRRSARLRQWLPAAARAAARASAAPAARERRGGQRRRSPRRISSCRGSSSGTHFVDEHAARAMRGRCRGGASLRSLVELPRHRRARGGGHRQSAALLRHAARRGAHDVRAPDARSSCRSSRAT